MSGLAPIVLFTYNRPDHTQKTIMALSQNMGASESELFIYSDAPRTNKDSQNVEEVRRIIDDVKGFKSVHVTKRDSNVGLANNIIDGVTHLVKKYGAVIVLEDDILTSRYFLKYMNDGLNKYRNSDSVMAISGYTQPISTSELPETFFLPWFDCWGWGTWERAWTSFERDPKKLIRETSADEIFRININGSDLSRWKQVIANNKHQIHTWAIFFFASICKNKGLVLHAKQSLCRNIGLDGSGENSGTIINAPRICVFDRMITEFPNEYIYI